MILLGNKKKWKKIMLNTFFFFFTLIIIKNKFEGNTLVLFWLLFINGCHGK